MSKLQIMLFAILTFSITAVSAQADTAVVVDRGQCLKSAELVSVNSKAYRVGVGVVFSRKWASSDSDMRLMLEKNDGETAIVDVYLQGIEFGVTAALEGVYLDFQTMALTLPNELDSCVLPMALFKTFYGTGIGAGASLGFGGEVELSALTNGEGVGLFFGPGIQMFAAGAHASVIPFKTMKIRPRDGFYSLDPKFFGKANIENKVNGARDIKW